MSTVSLDAHSHAHADHAGHAHAAGFLKTYVFSLDHKIIGLQFLFSTLLWFLVGGMLALGVRWQLAYPWRPMPILGNLVAHTEGGQIAPEVYTMLVTMHASVMIFFVIIPILAGAFGNFLIPLMTGADDMAFPTLNMLSYWFMWPAFFTMGGAYTRLDTDVAGSRIYGPSYGSPLNPIYANRQNNDEGFYDLSGGS